MEPDNINKHSLSKNTSYLIHGSLGLILSLFAYPLAIFLPPLYGGELGLSLSWIGALFLLARLIDLITDPLIGYLSDSYRTPFGRRKPWIVIGAAILLLGVSYLFLPSDNAGLAYFIIWLSVCYLGWTMILIPYMAWGSDLAEEYHQRSKVTVIREFFIICGLILAAAIPAYVESRGKTSMTAIVEAMAYVIFILVPILIFVITILVKEKEKSYQGRETRKISMPGQFLKLIRENSKLNTLLIIVFLVITAEAFRNSLSVFFIREVVKLDEVGTAYLFYFLSSIVALPVWFWLSKKIDKHRAFSMAMILVSMISIAMFFLSPGQYTAFYILFIVKGFCFGAFQFIPLSMIADLVEMEEKESGLVKGGSIFALIAATQKIALALGQGLSLMLLDLTGFEFTADVAKGADSIKDSATLLTKGILGLAVLYALVPVLFFMMALKLSWNFSIMAMNPKQL